MQVEAAPVQASAVNDRGELHKRIQALQTAKSTDAEAAQAQADVAAALSAEAATSAELLAHLRALSNSISCGVHAASAAYAQRTVERARSAEHSAAGTALTAKQADLTAVQGALEHVKQHRDDPAFAGCEPNQRTAADVVDLTAQLQDVRAELSAARAAVQSTASALAACREAVQRTDAVWTRAQDDIAFRQASVRAAEAMVAQYTALCGCMRAIADTQCRCRDAAASLREAERSSAEVCLCCMERCARA